MFICISYPFSDARGFMPEFHRLDTPGWPFPSIGREFVRAFGKVRLRRGGGISGWTGEDVFCGAARAIRFNPSLSKNLLGEQPRAFRPWVVFRRLFVDAAAAARVDIGFDCRMEAHEKASAARTSQILRDLLSLPSRIVYGSHDCRKTTLAQLAVHLADHYFEMSSRFEEGGPIDPSGSRAHIIAGTPLIIVDYKPEDCLRIPGSAKRVKNASIGSGITISHMNLHHQATDFSVWYLLSTHDVPHSTLRRLRLNLVRLHTEYQAIRGILRLILTRRLPIHRGSDPTERLQIYLNRATQLLSKENRFGVAQSPFLNLVRRVYGIVNEVERTALMEVLEDIRPTLKTKIEGITTMEIIMGDKISDNSVGKTMAGSTELIGKVKKSPLRIANSIIEKATTNETTPSQKLWSSLIEVDHYLAYDLLDQMNGVQSFEGHDMKPIMSAATTLRETKPFISKELVRKADLLLDNLERSINKFLDVLRVAIQSGGSEAHKEHVVEQLRVTLAEYRSGMDHLACELSRTDSSQSKCAATTDSQAVILFLGANPSDETRLALTKEAQVIGDRLRSAKHRDVFRIEQQWESGAKHIPAMIMRFNPSIVHFSGHGSESGALIFVDSEGTSSTARIAAITEMFRLIGENVRCVVLNACFSETQALEIVKHIDVVIGMNDAIGDADAIAFAGAFYEALAYRRDAVKAFHIARNAIDLSKLPDKDVPRIFVRDGVNASDIYFC